jgi:hypothetical protein
LEQNPGHEFEQINNALRDLMSEMERVKKLSESIESAEKSVSQAGSSLQQASQAMVGGSSQMAKVAESIKELDPKGLRTHIDKQSAAFKDAHSEGVQAIIGKINVVTGLAAVSLIISIVALAVALTRN